MGFLSGIVSGYKESFKKVAGAVTKSLDITAAVARNPLAILSPNKEAEKIKKLRTEGTQAERNSYIKTVAVQTALNVGGTLAAGGALGAAAAKTATTLGSKAITLGVIASPLIIGSSTIRETVAGFSPVAAGVGLGEKIESGVKNQDDKSNLAAAVIGTVAAGGVVAAGVLAYDYFKDKKEEKSLETTSNLPTTTLNNAVIPTNNQTPTLPTTQTVTVGNGLSSTKKKRRSKAKQPLNNTIRNNIMINNNINSTKQQTKKYLKARTF